MALHSELTVEISPVQAKAMSAIIDAVEAVVALPTYREAVLAYAAPSARFSSPSLGGLLGYDFHLSEEGPFLIEINTNAGGVLLCDETGAQMERDLVHMFHAEWRLGGRGRPLCSVAIVDETPLEQFLYPEFLAFQELLRRHGIEAHIASPEQLRYRDGRLWLEESEIDLLYNRLTDFTLTQPQHASLFQAYRDGTVVVTPHPYAHALYADKRNMAILGDESVLAGLGVPDGSRRILQRGIPSTRLVTAENAAQLWQARQRLYFKPAYGYGSKGVYSGEKLTRRVWETIQQGGYVAQQRVPPSRIAGPQGELKLDLRHYVYAGRSRLRAARLYRGQTTNLRTPGGGFARVRVCEITGGSDLNYVK
jgi:hypothetical protein